ncbi:glycine--tRNA ligase 2 [Pyrus ussuriensis x Pyrus communis]|uniref:Glycine--tRNA ligase 2 n=1 Tax=Pyrus ussuriensis x Pyrus communis TaxID=2448454 RepID=A0A5N5FKB2_9ROSA|nr:glycine--tRNA ligase 2 [Pyrus ussuriensis x Pyrus communis]
MDFYNAVIIGTTTYISYTVLSLKLERKKKVFGCLSQCSNTKNYLQSLFIGLALKDLTAKLLTKQRLSHGETQAFGTPCRLVLISVEFDYWLEL